MWNNVADGRNTLVHDDVLFDLQDCHEWAAHCAIAHHGSLVGRFCARQRQQEHHVGWDATDGRKGGAECTVWETLLEMERCNHSAGEREQGAIALVHGVATGRRSPSWVGLGDAFRLPRKILRVLCWYFEHQRRVQFERCVAESLPTITAIFLGSTGSCLLLRMVLQDALSEVMEVYPSLKLKVFVDDITAFMEGMT